MNGWAFFAGYFGVLVLVAVCSLPLLLASLPGTVVLSRYREYAADRGAVALTGDPVTLAEALGSLHGVDTAPETDLRKTASLSAFCIVPGGSLPATVTHPPTHKRIRRLKELAADIEQ